ncbi:class I SAM-dependent methyltransferase [Cupriavidus basilensis]|uniref:class I SAM-dependent methyltransferase n=1 Tax=Cupriavidus basilensis TaxID=68895 RepID=UPI0009E1C8C4|nr:class I SAM-dependent methyltransferase [Cupriavidus basilensis]
MTNRSHWEDVYQHKTADQVSWYAPHLQTSLAYIQAASSSPTSSILDIGGGESTLVDDLLDSGYASIAVNDISEKALAVCRERLGSRASRVHWLEGDVLEMDLPVNQFDVWHDRAVFHFLTEPSQRARYVEQVMHALKEGGWAIVGSFGANGPTQCSGLPVQRYTAESLHSQFGDAFELMEHKSEHHLTPWGSSQEFVYCLCRKRAG